MHLHLSDEENKAKGEEENNGVYTFNKCLLIFRWWYKGLEQDFTFVVHCLHAFKT